MPHAPSTSAIPNASSKGEYYVFFALLSMVEGMALASYPLAKSFPGERGKGGTVADTSFKLGRAYEATGDFARN